MDKKELKSRAHLLKPTIQIGKNKLSVSQINEIKLQLKKRKLIKVKILKSAVEDKDELIAELLNSTKSELIQKVGNIITLYKN